MDPRSESQATGSFPAVTADSVVTDAARPAEQPAWLAKARGDLQAPGRFLAWEVPGRRMVVPLREGRTRIGRSMSADVRFDDATVSRRHALVESDDDGVHLFDDRSLNGLQLNGRRVERSALADGDSILIGRHTLWFLDTAPAAAAAAAGEPASSTA
jgi:pSer/pThr/pTyr-binding forkhead associated (FHA) protein